MPLPGTIWTIGHSTRSLEVFFALLAGNRIEALADVRRFPGSRKYPHFNADNLAQALRAADIGYASFAELGGRRKPSPGSRNSAWRNAAFRGYADYMDTDEFRHGMKRLTTIADGKRTAIMCSEAVWWRCHRSLIADWLKARGVRVLHILDAGKVAEHPWTSAARMVNGELDYGG